MSGAMVRRIVAAASWIIPSRLGHACLLTAALVCSLSMPSSLPAEALEGVPAGCLTDREMQLARLENPLVFLAGYEPRPWGKYEMIWCPQVTAGPAPTRIPAPALDPRLAAQLDRLIQLNNDFFIGGSVSGVGASSKQTQTGQNTGGADPIAGSQQDIQPGSVAGGVVVGYNGPIINLSGFRFIPGVVGSVEWTDATGTIETIQNVGATRIATNNTIAFHRIITAGGRLTIGNLPSLLGMSGTMPFLPFVEGGEAWVNKSITWNPISGPAGVSLFSERRTLNLASPYVGAGVTGVTTWNGVPLIVTGQVNHIFPTDNKVVSFGNPATLSQSFFVRQSVTEAKLSVTVPVDFGELFGTAFGTRVQSTR